MTERCSFCDKQITIRDEKTSVGLYGKPVCNLLDCLAKANVEMGRAVEKTDTIDNTLRRYLSSKGFTETKKSGLWVKDLPPNQRIVDLNKKRLIDLMPEIGIFDGTQRILEGHGINEIEDIKQEIEGILKSAKHHTKQYVMHDIKKPPGTDISVSSQEFFKTPISPVPGGESHLELSKETKPAEVVKSKGEMNKMEAKKEEKTLAVIVESTTSGFLSPATTIENAIAVFDMFEQAKTKLLKDSDVLWIGANGRPASKGTGHPHIKRSGWRKLARFFGINCSIVDKEKLISKDSEGEFYLWKFRVRAHLRDGFFEAIGVCSSRDPFFSKKGGIRVEPDEADIMMKAQTVAFNRAISDLLGSGEVSADEIKSEEK